MVQLVLEEKSNMSISSLFNDDEVEAICFEDSIASTPASTVDTAEIIPLNTKNKRMKTKRAPYTLKPVIEHSDTTNITHIISENRIKSYVFACQKSREGTFIATVEKLALRTLSADVYKKMFNIKAKFDKLYSSEIQHKIRFGGDEDEATKAFIAICKAEKFNIDSRTKFSETPKLGTKILKSVFANTPLYKKFIKAGGEDKTKAIKLAEQLNNFNFMKHHPESTLELITKIKSTKNLEELESLAENIPRLVSVIFKYRETEYVKTQEFKVFLAMLKPVETLNLSNLKNFIKTAEYDPVAEEELNNNKNYTKHFVRSPMITNAAHMRTIICDIPKYRNELVPSRQPKKPKEDAIVIKNNSKINIVPSGSEDDSWFVKNKRLFLLWLNYIECDAAVLNFNELNITKFIREAVYTKSGLKTLINDLKSDKVLSKTVTDIGEEVRSALLGETDNKVLTLLDNDNKCLIKYYNSINNIVLSQKTVNSNIKKILDNIKLSSQNHNLFLVAIENYLRLIVSSSMKLVKSNKKILTDELVSKTIDIAEDISSYLNENCFMDII